MPLKPLPMSPHKLKTLSQLKRILPAGEVSFDTPVLKDHAGDKWFAAHQPDAVVLPRTTGSVSAVLRFANRHRIPVTPRGAGHGYVGACVPVRGGIVLSLARMKRIKEINAADFVAVVQPGVNTKELQQAVEKRGLFYPPDPASRADNAIGGNIITNAGGPRCLKYGVTRDYVLGLEVVIADGTVLRLGGRTHKNKTGFELHRLFVGSEGLLGVVTEATLKLLPLPPYRACLAVGFGSMRAAVRSLHAILAAGFLPAALELADSFTLAAAFKRTGSERLRGCRAHLIVELDGQPRSVRGGDSPTQGPARPAETALHRDRPGRGAVRSRLANPPRVLLRPARHRPHEAQRGHCRAARPARGPVRLRRPPPAQARALRACFGHAGDGNIHTNVMVDFKQPGAKRRSEAALDELFKQVLAWGGAITGEHGIGLAKQRWWPLAVSKEVRAFHHTIKRALDPHGILNPGKFI